MVKTVTMSQWSENLKRALAKKDEAMDLLVEKSLEEVKAKAQANIGHLQPEKGPYPAWEPLAPSTIKDKQRQGYDFNQDHNPLFRTGRLQHSIRVIMAFKSGYVTSDDPIAVYQEFGTVHIPPRPFMAPAMYTSLPSIAHRSMAMMKILWMGERITLKKASYV